jgi:hypothetical protein
VTAAQPSLVRKVKIQVTVLPTGEMSKRNHHALPRGVWAEAALKSADWRCGLPDTLEIDPNNGPPGSGFWLEVGLEEIIH